MLNTITVATHTTPVVLRVAFAHLATKVKKLRDGESTGMPFATRCPVQSSVC